MVATRSATSFDVVNPTDDHMASVLNITRNQGWFIVPPTHATPDSNVLQTIALKLGLRPVLSQIPVFSSDHGSLCPDSWSSLETLAALY